MHWYVLLVILLLVFIWAAFTYNKLIALKRLSDEAFSGISVQLKRRNDLIPNLVEVVKGYTKHESTLLEELTRLRTQLGQRLNTAGVSPELVTDAGALAHSLERVLIAVENYPELKASEHFIALHKGLEEVEDALQMSRRYYNGTVRNYKIKLESFPSLIIAKLFSFEGREFFMLDEASAAQAPEVKL
ncbi:LemA family protein [Desulfovibrio sp. OttesenSCG-928-F07]|nr:LemA family protein [Desulfovibrio sp. OttesenSCG-928-F07]